MQKLPTPSGDGEHTSPLVVHSAVVAQTWKPPNAQLSAHATSMPPPPPPPSEIIAQHTWGRGHVRALWHDTLIAGRPVMLASIRVASGRSPDPELDPDPDADSDPPPSSIVRSLPTVAVPPHAAASAAPTETQHRPLMIFMETCTPGGASPQAASLEVPAHHQAG